MNRFLILLCLFAVGGLSSLRGQVVERRPVPAWLGGASGYEVRFQHREPLLMAILLIVADREVTVVVNDKAVGTAADPARASSLDLTSHLRPGANTIALRARDGAPVRVAALLELNGDLSARHWLATGAAWTAAGGAKPVETAMSADPAANPFDSSRAIDAYSSWKLARPDQQSQATDPSGFTLPPGFQAELIRSARPGEDSWVALSFDPRGRIVLAREKRGLLRLDPAGGIEVIDDTLLECRGLLHHGGALYAHANNTKALFRLRDADGDDIPEEITEILRTEGGVGHGRNHLKLGPDGHLWIALGNNVRLHPSVAADSPLRDYAADQALPNPWDPAMFDGDVQPPAGHILRLHPDGGRVELIAGGLRNPVDIAFHRDGDLFTFDADMEWDIHAPWYMPNRVLHLVSAADFGWRRGTGRYPDTYPDTLPGVVDVGLGSPTAVFFGYGARLPGRYAEALYICDWAYGRILAVHLRPDGASYSAETETFITGRPLNVTDGCIGPDGALWFITGGRGTQSGLYRVTHPGTTAPAPAGVSEKNPLRELRLQLEVHHRGIPESRHREALAFILPHLDHEDRFIRHAARVALERLPAPLWQGQILGSPPGWRAILGGLALARVGGSAPAPDLLDHLQAIPWEPLSAGQRFALLRAVGVTLARQGDPDPARRDRWLARLEPLYPAGDFAFDQELCRLLVRLGSPVVLERTLPLLHQAASPEALIYYPLQLRYIATGWDLESRRIVFQALNRAAEYTDGGRNYTKAIQDLRAEHAAALTPDEATALADLIRLPASAAPVPSPAPGPLVRAWTLEDLAPRLDQVGAGRSFDKGRAAAISTGCVLCHRISADPAVPAGLLGPDLVQVAARFGRRDLLDHILNPSKVVDEKYRILTVTRTDGTRVTGGLESEDDERIILKPQPLAPDTIAIGKSRIASREISTVSTMPPGLLNTLTEAQILDLLAYLEAGGDAKHRLYQP
jgi:putative heme-binding domain-containing protein